MADDFRRDRWDRPLIIQVDADGIPQPDEKPVPYVRASKLPDMLKDSEQLTKWKMRKVAEGLLLRPDLMTRLAGIFATMEPDDRRTKGALNGVCDQAMEAAKASSGSSRGTGLHSLTEAVDRGQSVPWVGAEDEARLDAYRDALLGSGYTPLEWELRVVNDDLRSAGTFDRLWLCPDGRVRIGDLKTGKWDAQYPLGVTVQIAGYARSKRYDVETGQRSVIHPDLDMEVGLLVHLPEPAKGEKPECNVVPLDLKRGYHAATVASLLYHDIRKWKAKDLTLPSFFDEGASMTQAQEKGVAE